MIPTIVDTLFHEVSRIEFTDIDNRVNHLEELDFDHWENETSLQRQIINLTYRTKELEMTLIDVTRICLKLTAFLTTTYKQPVGKEEIETLTAAIDRLTINGPQ